MKRWWAGGRVPVGLIVASLLLTTLKGTSLNAAPRTWTDVSGKFSVEAELVERGADQVVLQKNSGEQITVPIARLSGRDRRYLAALSRMAGDAADGDNPHGVSLGEAKTHRLRIGLEITGRGLAVGLVAAAPVPMDWPEQKVRIVDEEKTRNVRRTSFRTLNGGARQLLIHVPRLTSGETARATVTMEVERHALLGPDETGGFRIPERPDRQLRYYLQPGPLTNSRDPTIVAAKNKAVEAQQTAWGQVHAIHGWVLDNVKYTKRPEIKTAGIALQEKVGDCQELSSLFVAMCRAHGVPARCVWIPRHSYAEFYLEDAQGRGYWFPVESTDKEQFGFLPRTDVILQKGDNFRVPELGQPTHYARTVLKAADIRGGQPEVREIFEVLDQEN